MTPLASFRKFLLPFILSLLPGLAIAAQVFERGLPDFSGLVETQGAAVVNISSTQVIKRPHMQRRGMPEFPEGHPFNDLFRNLPDQEEGEQNGSSLGSGFIISPDGYILTCAHVVDNSKEIVVKLTDRREFSAKIIGADKRSDVALLKIEAAGLPVARIGDPGKLRVGDWVLAIGSPFGFDNTATAGIVSAKGRALPRENYVPFIQTDVAINPGNSGGPLFNLQGEVVGINSQIYSRTGGFMGLSFAVPIDMAITVSKQLRSGGKVKRGWLGVTIQDVTRELADSFGMKKPHGALIADILSDGPAARSDLKTGDVVIEFDDGRVQTSSDLPPLVGQTSPGARVKVVLIRGGQTQTVWLTIGELPDETAGLDKDAGDVPAERKGPLGLAVAPLSDAQRKQANVGHGLLVKDIDKGAARDAGVRPGDILLQLNGKALRSITDLKEIVAAAQKGKTLPLLVRRGGGSQFLALKM